MWRVCSSARAVWVGASNSDLAMIRVVSCHGRHRVLLEPTAKEASRLITEDLLVLDLQQGIRNQIRVFLPALLTVL